jgi:hypothetical protein
MGGFDEVILNARRSRAAEVSCLRPIASSRVLQHLVACAALLLGDAQRRHVLCYPAKRVGKLFFNPAAQAAGINEKHSCTENGSKIPSRSEDQLEQS